MLQHLRDIQSHPAPPSISKGDAERMPIYFHRQRKMVKTNDDNGIYGATKKANCHAEQVKRQERIEQGTLNSFLNDGENGTTHRARRTSHLLDIRKKANQAVDEAAIANGLLTRSQKQKQSLNITFMAGRAAKFARTHARSGDGSRSGGHRGRGHRGPARAAGIHERRNGRRRGRQLYA